MSDPMREVDGGGVLDPVAEAVTRQADAYSHGEDRPLRGYVILMGAYAATVMAGVALVRARRLPLPRSIGVRDVALISAATLQLARIVTKKPITSPLRAPFTRFDGATGPAELSETVRGTGMRHAVGELVTCPFCIGHWIVTGFGFGLVLAPDATRLVAAMLSAEAAADFLEFAYARAQRGTD